MYHKLEAFEKKEDRMTHDMKDMDSQLKDVKTLEGVL